MCTQVEVVVGMVMLSVDEIKDSFMVQVQNNGTHNIPSMSSLPTTMIRIPWREGKAKQYRAVDAQADP